MIEGKDYSAPEQLVFDLAAARAARDDGIDEVTENNHDFLLEARRIAVLIGQQHGTVTMDDVRKVCTVKPSHPNAWGAVFKDKRFEWTGQYHQSARVQGQGNLQRVWRLS